MNNAVKAQETVQYPVWQEAIRKAQAEQDACDAERSAQWAADTRKHKLDAIERFRQKLEEQGLVLPESTIGEWMVGDYTFSYNVRSESTTLTIIKAVPGANNELMQDPDDDSYWRAGYRAECFENIQWRDLDGATIADAIDALDSSVIEQIEKNRRALEQIEAKARQPKSENVVKPAPSIEDRLLELIREIVREEMGVIRDSQFESLL